MDFRPLVGLLPKYDTLGHGDTLTIRWTEGVEPEDDIGDPPHAAWGRTVKAESLAAVACHVVVPWAHTLTRRKAGDGAAWFVEFACE
jgi:hypothetical protein